LAGFPPKRRAHSLEGWGVAVDWENERYVRVYTRDTADLLAVGWEGRLVWYEMLRHCDRSGLIDTGGDIAPVAEMLRVPVTVFDVAIPRLEARGMIAVGEKAVLLPNFMEAQEAKQSDRQRQRESRARRLAAAKSPANVTERDHKESQNVTDCHDRSQLVTPSLAVPSLADPPLSPHGGRKPNGIPEKAVREAAAYVIDKFNDYFKQDRKPAAWLDDVRRALKSGYSPKEQAAACFGCWQTCNDSAAVLRNCSPHTALRLKHREGKQCLPQWVEHAEILWREKNRNADYPWLEQLEFDDA